MEKEDNNCSILISSQIFSLFGREPKRSKTADMEFLIISYTRDHTERSKLGTREKLSPSKGRGGGGVVFDHAIMSTISDNNLRGGQIVTSLPLTYLLE